MKQKIVTTLLVVFLSTACSNAFAWHCWANNNGKHQFTSRYHSTREGAFNSALDVCARRTINVNNCHVTSCSRY